MCSRSTSARSASGAPATPSAAPWSPTWLASRRRSPSASPSSDEFYACEGANRSLAGTVRTLDDAHDRAVPARTRRPTTITWTAVSMSSTASVASTPTAMPGVAGNPILSSPPLRTMARLVPPSVASTLVQSMILLVEAYWLGALGTRALAAVALVFPAYMLANMLASGAIGGAVSGALARALGAGRPDRAQEVVNAAWMIAFVVGGLVSVVMLLGGEALFRLLGGRDEVLGGRDEVLAGALEYSRIVFGG